MQYSKMAVLVVFSDMKYFLNIGDFENKLFDYLCDANGKLPITKFKKVHV